MTADGITVLILGFSRIAQRRVLPAFQGLAKVRGIEIASRRGRPENLPTADKVTRFHEDFTVALETTEADLVYVSTVNSEHAEWVERALLAGRHVVVDKPAVVRLADGERLVALAKSRGLCLAESVVWAAHPQVERCRQIFAQAGSRPTRLTAIFSMPPLAPDNFRYRAELGGGALWDLGPYAVSLGRELFAAEPSQLWCTTTSWFPRLARRGGLGDVDTAFSLLARYPEGRSLVGHFGFDTEYRNEVTVLGPSASVHCARIFTTPPDLENELRIQIGNSASLELAPAADSFGCFFESVIEAIRPGGEVAGFAEYLASDLRVLTRMRGSAKET